MTKVLKVSVKKQTLENIVEKGENAGKQQFLLFPECSLLPI